MATGHSPCGSPSRSPNVSGSASSSPLLMVIRQRCIFTSAVAFGEYGDRELAQRALQFPLRDVRRESPGLDAVDVFAGLGQVPGRHVDRGVLGQPGPPAGVLAAGGIHGASED
jgi:hypothetical protein